MSAGRYERKVFKDLIREAIYEAIVDGELKPGDRIIEAEWAEKLGSSQAPVREAIRDLEGYGVVESAPFKGAVVRVVGKKEMDEIHMVRAGLETAALKKVIAEAPDDFVKKSKRTLDEMKKAAKANDFESFLDKDYEFHKAFVDFADIPDLTKMWNMCNIRIWTKYGATYSKRDLIELAGNHEAIYKKIEERDPTEIFETVSRHFEIVIESMDEEIKE